MSNFGAGFKKARESTGLPLERIAAETRISTRFLKAIENEDFHLLPGGIFNRGFIRAYAERVGIDPEQAVADYERLSSAVDQDSETHAERTSEQQGDKTLYPIAAAILLLLIAGYYLMRSDTATVAESPPVVSGPAAPLANEPPAPAPTPAPQEPAPAAPETPAPPALADSNPVSSPLVVDLDVRNITWIEILADGERVVSENLEPGPTRRYTAQSSLDISIGNAAGASLRINGRDLGSLGRDGQVREFKITPGNAATIGG